LRKINFAVQIHSIEQKNCTYSNKSLQLIIKSYIEREGDITQALNGCTRRSADFLPSGAHLGTSRAPQVPPHLAQSPTTLGTVPNNARLTPQKYLVQFRHAWHAQPGLHDL